MRSKRSGKFFHEGDHGENVNVCSRFRNVQASDTTDRSVDILILLTATPLLKYLMASRFLNYLGVLPLQMLILTFCRRLQNATAMKGARVAQGNYLIRVICICFIVVSFTLTSTHCIAAIKVLFATNE